MVMFIGGRNTRAIFKGVTFGQSNASSYTFAGLDFDAPSPRRRIVAGFHCSHLTANLAIPDTCTIGGIAATRDFTNPLATGGVAHQFWSAIVPTGLTGTIFVSRPATMGYGALLWWVLYDLPTGAVAGTLSNFANPSSGGLATLAGGLAIGFAQSLVATSFAWTGLTKEAAGEAIGGGTAATVHVSAATKAGKTIAETLSISANQSASNQLTAIAYR